MEGNCIICKRMPPESPHIDKQTGLLFCLDCWFEASRGQLIITFPEWLRAIADAIEKKENEIKI